MGPLTHLDREDTPGALAILDDVIARHRRAPAGYEITVDGAWVHWDVLAQSCVLSAGEVAAVHIARGCALAERIGGLPASSAQPVLTAIERVTAKQ